MLEDALKSTRMMHRLIMAVSTATLVFSLSLTHPEEELAQKAAIEALVNIDFISYRRFVAEHVRQYEIETLESLRNELDRQLDSFTYRVHELGTLANTIANPIYIADFSIESSPLADISSATLSELQTINDRCLSCEVQVVVADTGALVAEITEFLDRPSSGTKRVTEIRIEIDPDVASDRSFLSLSTIDASIYFELVDVIERGGAPTFFATFSAVVTRLPGSSFLDWLNSTNDANGALSVKDGQLAFAAAIDSIPIGHRDESLGSLHQRLTDEITLAAPERSGATILGTRVPGVLIVVASPLILLVLSYYFAMHMRHLERLVSHNSRAFSRFAWMPLALAGDVIVPVGRRNTHAIPVWALETIASATLLPVGSLVILAWQLNQFAIIELWPSSTVLVAAAIGIVKLGIGNLKTISRVRRSANVSTMLTSDGV